MTRRCQPVNCFLMETPEHIARQRFLAGHPALDLVNSGAGEGGPELIECLHGYADVVAWAYRAEIVTEELADRLLVQAGKRPDEAAEVFARCLETRGEIDRIFRALAAGTPPPPDAVRHLRDAETEALSHAELAGDDGRFSWTWIDAMDLGVVLWPVVHAATELLTSEALDRVKLCAGCPWLFFDASKNHSRRWCAMDDGCGSEAKMRNYIARRAARQRAR